MEDLVEILSNVELDYDNKNGNYYLNLTYEGEDEIGNTHRSTIEKIKLPLYKNSTRISSRLFQDSYIMVDVGFGFVPVFGDVKDEIICYAEKEMTIREIEEKLGHKVKIVNEVTRDKE